MNGKTDPAGSRTEGKRVAQLSVRDNNDNLIDLRAYSQIGRDGNDKCRAIAFRRAPEDTENGETSKRQR
jgi:hypothetical protein